MAITNAIITFKRNSLLQFVVQRFPLALNKFSLHVVCKFTMYTLLHDLNWTYRCMHVTACSITATCTSWYHLIFMTSYCIKSVIQRRYCCTYVMCYLSVRLCDVSVLFYTMPLTDTTTLVVSQLKWTVLNVCMYASIWHGLLNQCTVCS